MANSTHHALVIGASGLIGWSVVNQLLAPYPSLLPYSKVTGLVNRPLRLSKSFWPKPALGRPSFALTTGVDLLCSDGELVRILKEKVENVESITHVYYCGKLPSTFSNHRVSDVKAAFKEISDSEKEVEINVGMMRHVVQALIVLSPNLQFFVYPGGTRVGSLTLQSEYITDSATGLRHLSSRWHFHSASHRRHGKHITRRLRKDRLVPPLPRHARRRKCKCILVMVRTLPRHHRWIHT
jgi:hypothetical protein